MNLSIYKCFLILLTTYSTVCCNSIISNSNEVQKLKETDLNKLKLKGKVFSVIETSYEAIPNFQEINKGDRKRSSSRDYKKTFNTAGNLVENIQYKLDGSIYSKRVYSYDEQNQLVSYDLYNYQGKKVIHKTYEYDEDGNKTIMESRSAGQNEKFIYSYNNGLLFKLTSYMDEEKHSLTTYKYDQNDSLIESVYHNKKENSLFGSEGVRKVYSRNNLGFIEAETSSTIEGEEIKRITYTYRNKKLIKKLKTSHFTGSNDLTEYEYYNNNVLKEVRSYDDYSIRKKITHDSKMNVKSKANEIHYTSLSVKRFDFNSNLEYYMTKARSSRQGKTRWFENTYDETGNLSSWIEYESVNPKYIVEREIKYNDD